MLLAALGDCLGNVHAARAALGAIADRGIMTVLDTGNAVAGFPWPQETLGALTEHGAVSAQDDLDRAAARALRRKTPGDSPADRAAAYAHAHLASASVEAVRAWPIRRSLTLEGLAIHWFSGTPSAQRESLEPEAGPMRFQRIREELNAPLIVYGRNEEPHARWVDGALFVCPGAAGLGGPARYAVIDTDAAPWAVSFHEAPYDETPLAPALAAAGLDDPRQWRYAGASRRS